MNAQSYTHAEPNNLIYTIKTHYAGLLLNRLREINELRNGASPWAKHNPNRVHITEIFDDGSEDDTQPTYTLRYHSKAATQVLEINITESQYDAHSDRIEKTIVINDEDKRCKYTFNIYVLRDNVGDPIVLPTRYEAIRDKSADSRIAELDREILTTLDLCVN